MSTMVTVCIFMLLLATRFVGLTWGIPFLMHPDERNMADAITHLHWYSGMNPQFYAYGQLPLYLVWLQHALLQRSFDPVISSAEAALGLRLLSALASLVAGVVLYRLLIKESGSTRTAQFGLLLWTFTPAMLQFAHFGTTESLLSLFFLCLLLVRKNPLYSGLFLGLSIGTKVSAAVLCIIPLYAIGIRSIKKNMVVLLIASLAAVAASPHSLLSYEATRGSLSYEAAIATGGIKVFYTYQFEHINRLLFPFVAIFPYALGLPLLVMGALGLVYTIKHRPLYPLLAALLFCSLLPLYTQWTRFYLYLFVLIIIIASYASLYRRVFFTLLLLHVLFGLSYLSIYLTPDTRIAASEWMAEHLQPRSSILTESANVIMIPSRLPAAASITEVYVYNSENDQQRMRGLTKSLDQADYVVIPSRRVFANYSCIFGAGVHSKAACLRLAQLHPTLNRYYDDIAQGRKWKQIAIFSSYPRLGLFSFPDEFAEETWSVFDHPVVRVYERKK